MYHNDEIDDEIKGLIIVFVFGLFIGFFMGAAIVDIRSKQELIKANVAYYKTDHKTGDAVFTLREFKNEKIDKQ
jgi:hypothetical protein